MLPILTRFSISRKISYFKLCKIWGSKVKVNNFRPGNYSNTPILRNLSSLQRKHTLPYTCAINFRSLHNEPQLGMQDCIQKFENLLRNIGEDKNDLSIDHISSYIIEMTSLLDDLALEEHHGVKILKNKSITKLFNAVDKSIEQMPAKDLINALDLCYNLYVPPNAEVCCKIVSKLKNGFEDLNFADKVRFYSFLPHLIVKLEDRTVVQKLASYVTHKLSKEIKSKVYLNSPEDTAAALCFASNSLYIAKEDEENILHAVLGLKNWDHSFIFRYFFKSTTKTYGSPPQKYLYEQFLSRMQKETNHNYLHYFLHNYAVAIQKNIVEYDSDLVDSVVDKLVTSQITAIQIRRTIGALIALRHSHDGLMEYLIDWFKKNPYIFVSHPVLSSRIIGFMASFNNFNEDGNQLAEIQSVLRQNPNLHNMLRHVNPDFEHLPKAYLYSLLDLASLEIYIDEELINLSNYLKRRKIQNLSGKLQRFLLNLNEAVQLFHPNFKTALLSNENALTTIMEIDEKNPGKLQKGNRSFLQDVGSHLEVATGRHNCLLTRTVAKPSFQFEGIVAVNNEGQFHDFGEYCNEKGRVFLEDISLPEGFEFICLLVVSEKQFARNSLCLNAACRLRSKIQERLGLPTVVLYEPIWKGLGSDEKGNYLCKIILEKSSKKNSAENSSDIAQSLES